MTDLKGGCLLPVYYTRYIKKAESMLEEAAAVEVFTPKFVEDFWATIEMAFSFQPAFSKINGEELSGFVRTLVTLVRGGHEGSRVFLQLVIRKFLEDVRTRLITQEPFDEANSVCLRRLFSWCLSYSTHRLLL